MATPQEVAEIRMRVEAAKGTSFRHHYDPDREKNKRNRPSPEALKISDKVEAELAEEARKQVNLSKKLANANEQASNADKLANDKAYALEEELNRIRSGSKLRKDGVRTYDAVPVTEGITAKAGAKGTPALAEDFGIMGDNVGGRHSGRYTDRIGDALRTPYSGGTEGPKPTQVRSDHVGRRLRVLGPLYKAYETAKEVIISNSRLSALEEEHGIKLSPLAKAEYIALSTFSVPRETLTNGQDPVPMQQNLIKWGIKNKIPADALAKMQITEQKLSVEDIREAINLEKARQENKGDYGLNASAEKPAVTTQDQTKTLAANEKGRVGEFQIAKADRSQPVIPGVTPAGAISQSQTVIG